MKKRIILIDHHDNPGDDRMARHLASNGFDLDWYYPFKNEPLPEIADDVAGAAIYGGAQNVTEIEQFPFLQDEIEWIRKAMQADLPLLGICLGAQLIAHTLGGKVSAHENGLYEFGFYPVQPTEMSGNWFPESMHVTQAHYQQFELPENAILLAKGEHFPNQAFRYGDKVFALQFHPEVTAEIFRRWQDSDWAYFEKPGAQSRQEQDALITNADLEQGAWFVAFLDRMFGKPVLPVMGN